MYLLIFTIYLLIFDYHASQAVAKPLSAVFATIRKLEGSLELEWDDKMIQMAQVFDNSLISCTSYTYPIPLVFCFLCI